MTCTFNAYYSMKNKSLCVVLNHNLVVFILMFPLGIMLVLQDSSQC